MHILHAASEYQGLSKTGGLADMVAALTMTLHLRGHDVRVCLPAYRGTPQQLLRSRRIATMQIHGLPVDVIEGTLQQDGPRLWLIDCPPLFDRPGSPYGDDTNTEFSDNALRFACFGEAVSQLAMGAADWRADVVHLHDWHSGLAALRLARLSGHPRVLFTIHNLAYQGLFDRATFDALDLPAESWQLDGVEFYGQLSFMKAGLIYSDIITTVSANYAAQIQTEAYGCGLDGVLRQRSDNLVGIANGIDVALWNPATDTLLAANYDSTTVDAGKAINKRAVQRVLGLPPRDIPLLLFIGRLTHQKGADILLDAWRQLANGKLQLVILGCGDTELEQRCSELARKTPDKLAVYTDIDETLAHNLTAAADLQVMPSRFEPCGLSQLYAQRYGAIPVVHRTGGLADTVIDTDTTTLANGTATGVLFDSPDVSSLVRGLMRGMALLATPNDKDRVRQAGMARDFSWDHPAAQYERLYRE